MKKSNNGLTGMERFERFEWVKIGFIFLMIIIENSLFGDGLQRIQRPMRTELGANSAQFLK